MQRGRHVCTEARPRAGRKRPRPREPFLAYHHGSTCNTPPWPNLPQDIRTPMQTADWKRQLAFTLIELLITLIIVGAVMSVAVPSYQEYTERTRRTSAIKDIAVLALHIDSHLNQTGTLPGSLADLNITLPTDPWGRTYQYLAIDVVPPPRSNMLRRDKNLIPINSDFDLYSLGPDGQTQMQLTAAKARDDIVRAGNGGFIGLASEH